MATQSWIESGLTLALLLWAGWSFFARGAQSLIHRCSTMSTLNALSTGAAFTYSVVAPP